MLAFFEKIALAENAPSANNNIFYKGRDKDREEYSSWKAENNLGKTINDFISEDVIISGIATEYCIKETVLDLHKRSYNVTILANNLAYLEETKHKDTLEFLEIKGAKIIW